MTAKITVTLDGQPVTEHVLDKETVTIGRKSANDIVIDSMAVSGRHCQILNILNDSFLEDLESTNGTFVNGNRVKKYALSDNDVIVVGRHHLRFNKGGDADAAQDDERTVAVGAGVLDTFSATSSAPQVAQPMQAASPPPQHQPAPVQAAPAPQPAPAVTPPGGHGNLQLLNTARAGRTMELIKPVTTIGKPGSQVAAISMRADGYYIVVVDSGSGNQSPPTINSHPLGNQATKLNNNDVIEIAGVKLLFSG